MGQNSAQYKQVAMRTETVLERPYVFDAEVCL